MFLCQASPDFSRDTRGMSSVNLRLVISGYCGYMSHTSTGLAGACHAVPNISQSPYAHSVGLSPWLQAKPETWLNIIHCLLIFAVQKKLSQASLCVWSKSECVLIDLLKTLDSDYFNITLIIYFSIISLPVPPLCLSSVLTVNHAAVHVLKGEKGYTFRTLKHASAPANTQRLTASKSSSSSMRGLASEYVDVCKWGVFCCYISVHLGSSVF